MSDDEDDLLRETCPTEQAPRRRDAMAGHRRTRTGCLSCRVRRKKCDGGRPQCENCIRTHTTCSWGVKARFHPSRQLGLNKSDRQRLSSREIRSANAEMTESYQIVDKTDEIIRWCQTDQAISLPATPEDLNHHNEPDTSNLPPVTAGNVPPQTPADGIPSSNEQELAAPESTGPAQPHTEMNVSPDFYENQSASLMSGPIFPADIAQLEAYPLPFSLGLAASRITSPVPEVPLPITEKDVIHLLGCYFTETATWCETTDSGRHFSILCTHEILENKIFQGAALALSRRQLSMIGQGGASTALRLYQYTIQLLIQQDPEAADVGILAACTLLCVYEMMGSDVLDWRRHLKGCTAFFLSKGWNGSSPGLAKACFWAFARIDIWAAFTLSKPTLIPTDHWVDDESLANAASHLYPDEYCNLMIHHFAKIINCLATSSSPVRRSNYTNLLELWQRAQQWREERPVSVLPVYRSKVLSGTPFPGLVFASPSAICGTTFYHVASMLILREVPSLIATGDDLADPVWHAREVCGISVSNKDHANWVNHLQPLFVAGEIFSLHWNKGRSQVSHSPQAQRSLLAATSPESPQTATYATGSEFIDPVLEGSDFSIEKIALLQHLVRIQRVTGWSTEGRAKQLRRLWGLE